MALGSERRFSRGKIGLGGSVASSFNKFETHSSPQFHVGYKIETADGKVYRYAHFGANTNRGVLVSNDVSETSVVDTDAAVIDPASAVTPPNENAGAGTINSKFIQVSIASISDGDWAGGTLVITDDTGEGYSYDIKGNNATGDSASGNVLVELYDKLQVAVSDDTDFAIAANPYHDLEIASQTDSVPVGVTCSTVTVATAAYGWIQTKGIVGVLQGPTVPSIGDPVSLSANVNGSVELMGGTLGAASAGDLITETPVGFCIDPGDSTGHSTIMLELE